MVDNTMKIRQIYSHLNGVEFLMLHKPNLWNEIQAAIKNVDASQAFNKVSKEKRKIGKLLYNPKKMNELFRYELSRRSWSESRIIYYVNEDLQTTRDTVCIIDKETQKQEIIDRGYTPYITNNQVDFVKDRVAIEIQFGKYFSVQYDLHVKHTFFYGRGDIDVGIEIIPMHSLMKQMSSGVAWYENELTNIVREGRSNPSVPIILIGVEPDL